MTELEFRAIAAQGYNRIPLLLECFADLDTFFAHPRAAAIRDSLAANLVVLFTARCSAAYQCTETSDCEASAYATARFAVAGAPSAEGGTNDPENLITSCEPCNQGKAAKVIAQMAPTELDRLRLAQEYEEQKAAAEQARATVQNREAFLDEIVTLWCDIRGTQEVDRRTIRLIAQYAREFGVATVADWIERAHAKFGPYGADYKLGIYISGIRRRINNEREGRIRTCSLCGREMVLNQGEDPSLEWVHTACKEKAEAAEAK